LGIDQVKDERLVEAAKAAEKLESEQA